MLREQKNKLSGWEMKLFEIVVLTWLLGLTIGLFYAVFNIGQMTAVIDKLTENVRTIAKFIHTHEEKPSYTFNTKDIN